MGQHSAAHLYDRWEDQVALEKEMHEGGKERMQSRINRAQQKHDMNRLRPYRSLLQEWVQPVATAIEAWVVNAKARRGVKPIALPRMESLEPQVAAVVALKSVFRMLGIQRRGILAVAVEIGTWCEHEARCQKWQDEDPKDWNLQTHIYQMQGSNAAHQRRSRISLFNKHVWERIGWIEWTDQDRQRIGLELLNIIMETTKRFHVIQDPNWVPKKLKNGAYTRRPYVIDAHPELMDWLSRCMDDELVHSPVYWPTIIPPLDWVGPRDGGYYTPYVKSPFLIRIKMSNYDTKANVLDEFESLDMPEVYAALNRVQRTPWKINGRVYDIAKTIWDQDLAIAGFPRKEKQYVPERPNAPKDSWEYKAWARQAAKINAANAKRVSKFLATRRAMVVAERFLEEPAFYFPHFLDFRGRMYSIPNDLSPQGQDLHRGLLTFTEGKPIKSHQDAGWLAVHLANCFGEDKQSYEERIEWVQENRDMWLSIDADPLADRRWIGKKDDDDHWQRLAAVFEWVRWLKEGIGMVSSLPIRVDGTCNGIQHLSAMVRDEVGGASVNLLPSNRPRDIYQEVADRVTAKLHEKLPDPLADIWLRIFDGKTPRSVTKRPTMILPYGGTTHAYHTYTREWLDENDPDGVMIPDREQRTKAINFLVQIMWEAVGKTVLKAREVMKWLQDCAKEAAKEGNPLWWVTPAGFNVRQFYGQLSEVQRVGTRLDGQRVMLRSYEITKELDADAQAQAVAPNFTHSMDASALMTCVNIAWDNGIEAMTTIHDAFGTVAADMDTLSACIREAFIQTYSQPVLESFREACRQASANNAKLPDLPAFGALDLEQIRDANYFFA